MFDRPAVVDTQADLDESWSMHCRRIIIKNVRGLGTGGALLDLALTAYDGTLAGWHVVVGPNGSGKSTLLRAIALACAGPGVIKVLQSSQRWWMSQGASASRITVELEKGPADAWFVEGGRDGSGEFEGVGETCVIENTVQITGHGFTGSGTPHEPAAGPWFEFFDQTPGWFVAGYGATRHLTEGFGFPSHGGMRDSRPVAQLSSLFVQNGAIPDPVAWLKQLKLEAGQKKADKTHLPHILELISDGLLPGHAKAIAVDDRGLVIREGSKSYALAELSDGYQTVVGLVLDILRQLSRAYARFELGRVDGRVVVNNEGVILIDEIEAHLHPEWQARIGDWLCAHFPKMQFIVTTHSPFVCQSAASGSIVRLARADEGVPSRVLTFDELEPVISGTADDIYLSSVFGVASTRSLRGERLLTRASELEARILVGDANEAEVTEFQALKRQLPPSTEVLRMLRAAEHLRSTH